MANEERDASMIERDGPSPYDQIVAHALNASTAAPDQGGLIVLLYGFFMYEYRDGTCLGIVAPDTQVVPTGYHMHLWVEGGPVTRHPASGSLPPLRPIVLGPPQPAQVCATVPDVADFKWIPHWSRYNQAPDLRPDWRSTATRRLLLDLPCVGGVVTALRDRHTGEKEIVYPGNVIPPHRLSSLGLYVIPALPTATVTAALGLTGAPGGRPWSVLAITHRQLVLGGDVASEKALIGQKHDESLIALQPPGTNVTLGPPTSERTARLPSVPTLDTVLDSLEPPVFVDVPGERTCSNSRHTVGP